MGRGKGRVGPGQNWRLPTKCDPLAAAPSGNASGSGGRHPVDVFPKIVLLQNSAEEGPRRGGFFVAHLAVPVEPIGRGVLDGVGLEGVPLVRGEAVQETLEAFLLGSDDGRVTVPFGLL